MGYPERIEQYFNRLMQLKLTRPEFIMGSLAGGLALTGLGLYTQGRNTPKNSEFDVYPGWPESNIDSPFLQADKGHYHFLREGIFSNPDILGVTQDFFSLIGKHLDEKKVLPLGEALEFCQEKMRERLTGKRISPDANSDLEILHGAFFAFTAGYTAQWFSMEDLHTFGVPEKFKDSVEYYWGPQGVARLVFPGYFSTAELDDPTTGEVKNGGQDRAGHVASHGFLAFELMYSDLYNLGLENNMPLSARFLVWFGNVGTIAERVAEFSNRVGLFYEVSRLVHLRNWPLDGRTGRTIADGPFDDTVSDDFKGNRLGSRFGIAASRLFKNHLLFKALINEIDHKFKSAKDLPILFSSRPYLAKLLA